MGALLAVGIGHYTENTTTYQVRAGARPQPIAGMTPAARVAALLDLLATAPARMAAYRQYLCWDERPAVMQAGPRAWMVSTALFRALAAGLPAKRTRLAGLLAAARHTADCAGPCSCGGDRLPAPDPAVIADLADAVLTARSGGPR